MEENKVLTALVATTTSGIIPTCIMIGVINIPPPIPMYVDNNPVTLAIQINLNIL